VFFIASKITSLERLEPEIEVIKLSVTLVLHGDRVAQILVSLRRFFLLFLMRVMKEQ
jgi:hypothetical protein